MAIAVVPPGHVAYLLGTVTSFDDLGHFSTLEQGTPPGSLMLVQLQLEEALDASTVQELSSELAAAGIPAWPGYGEVVFTDPTEPMLYVAWQSAEYRPAWFWGIALPILGTLIGLPLIGAALWWIMPSGVTDMIEGIMTMGMMGMMMFGMMMFMPMLMPAEEK